MPLPSLSDDQHEQILRGLRPGPLPRHLLNRAQPADPATRGQRLPTYEEWMAATKLGLLKPRSSRLERIDKALKAVQAAPSVKSANELRAAITDWIRWKGPNWKQSERNKNHIVEVLRVQAFAPGLPVAVTREEEAAWNEVLKGSQRAIHTYFAGKKLTLRLTGVLSGAKDVGSQVKTTYSAFKKLAEGIPEAARPNPAAAAKAAKETTEFVAEGLMDLKVGDLAGIADLVPPQELIADLIPVVNLVVGGVKVLVKWGQVAKAAHLKHQTEDRAYVLERGDPAQAIRGLIQLLDRDTKSKAVKAGLETAKFGAQVAGAFVDGASATGAIAAAAKAAADLAQSLFLLGLQIKEARAANRLLADPTNLDYRLFEACPLLGCYLIRYATLSDIIALSTVQFGSSGWLDDVEQLKTRHIDPLRKTCDKFIKASLYEIKGMPLTPQT